MPLSSEIGQYFSEDTGQSQLRRWSARNVHINASAGQCSATGVSHCLRLRVKVCRTQYNDERRAQFRRDVKVPRDLALSFQPCYSFDGHPTRFNP